MTSETIGAVAGLAIGAYLVGLALYQMKNRVLITGRSGRGRMTGPLVWVFAPLEGLAGLAMFAFGAVSLAAAATAAPLAGACSAPRDLQCTEYRGDSQGGAFTRELR